MILTGISDEAGAPIETQIRAHKELGWDTLECRFAQVGKFEKGSIHEIPQEAFDAAATQLANAGIRFAGFGSTIGNWAHSIEDDFAITQSEVDRCIARMLQVDSKIVRIMSYAILKDADGNDRPDQLKAERFRRMREVTARFLDAGITPVHENCMNYGGMSISHALELLAEVPGLKWVFDTCNPVFAADRDNPGSRQDPWAFYEAVKAHTVHVHIKDGIWNPEKQDCDYTFPGAGHGDVERILTDLHRSGYAGYLSIEPHMAVVFHDTTAGTNEDPEAKAEAQFQNYVEYGQKLQALVNKITS